MPVTASRHALISEKRPNLIVKPPGPGSGLLVVYYRKSCHHAKRETREFCRSLGGPWSVVVGPRPSVLTKWFELSVRTNSQPLTRSWR